MRWADDGKNMDWSVSLQRGADSDTTTWWEGQQGRKALARYCEHLNSRQFLTGRNWASECRWSTLAILSVPVAMRRATFWTNCSVAIDQLDASGYQMGAA